MIERLKFDRYTAISDLGDVTRKLLRPGIPLLLFVVFAMAAKLFFTDQSGWQSLLWMGAGATVALSIWKSMGIGLPLLPMFAIQHFAAYGIPIFSRNEVILVYPDRLITQSGIEVFIFLLAAALAWRAGIHLFTPKRTFCYSLRAFTVGGSRVLKTFAMGLIIATTSHEVLQILGALGPFYEILPDGTYSIVTAMVNAGAMSGFFLVAMCIGSGEASNTMKATFWLMLSTSCVLMGASFLLSSTTNLIGAVTIGLFWGSGRVPWRFLAVAASILSFLHIGKFEMRSRYWQTAGEEPVAAHISLSTLVPHYVEWINASFDVLTAEKREETSVYSKSDSSRNQSMLDRVNNLQNLLFAFDAVENKKLPLLKGATYTLIPPLLVPRVLWPDKPRTHEGQIMLNVHFERQSLRDTYNTYVAWGLLPEAFGNFGAFWGAIILGMGCGLIFAWIEVVTVYKPLLSLEGLVTFALFIGLAVSFEMVASVLITSLFQSITTIVIACIPFVHRTAIVDPEDMIDEDVE